MAYLQRIGGTLTASILFCSFAHATIITEETVVGSGSLGKYTAHFKWDGSVLALELTNTSSAANGGYITGFLLELPDTSSFSAWQTNSNLLALAPNQEHYSGAPYGNYDYGYALGSNFLGGGKPQPGIAVGNTSHFEFSNWSGVAGFDVGNFFKNLATLEADDTNLLVRFRGFNDGGSDKVIGIFTPPPQEPPPEGPPPPNPPPPGLPPTPPNVEISNVGTLWLMAAPLLGLFLYFRRRREN